MKIPGVKTAKKFTRWVQARILGGALILGYHRVAEVMRDEYEVCVTPNHFAEQMEVLRKYALPISLSKLTKNLKEGSLHPKSVAVTFDDGYADNLYNAKSILEKYAIPATVFVCTGYSGKEFWWDELDRLIMSSKAKLDMLRLEVRGKSFVWNQPDVYSEAGVESRRKLLHTLYHLLLGLDVSEQNQIMASIRIWAGVAVNKTTARTMTHEELVQLTHIGDLIAIGAHTHFHLMLPRLTLERQREEIVTNKHELEKILGRPVEGFSYPNGRATVDAKQIVRDAGNFAFACTSDPNLLRDYEYRYEIPRFWPRNQDGNDFSNWLRRWL